MGEAMNRPKNAAKPMRMRGFKALAASRASVLATERVKREHPDLTGWEFGMQVAADLQKHLAEDMAAGMAFAREAVDVMRAAPDFDPAVHGENDEQIADWIVQQAEASRG